jgi:hypothetical protein
MTDRAASLSLVQYGMSLNEGAGQAHFAEQGSIDDLPTVLDFERRAATGAMACFIYDALALGDHHGLLCRREKRFGLLHRHAKLGRILRRVITPLQAE